MRSISLSNRKPGLVDLLIGRRSGISGFRFSAATNFDASFTPFQTVQNAGYKSPGIKDASAIGNPFRHQVRFIFNPSDYTTSVPAVRDSSPFFIKIESQNLDGSFNSPEAIHTILPYYGNALPPFILNGNIPSAADLSHSLEIQLPGMSNDWNIDNTGASNLMIAFDRGSSSTGSEYQLQPLATIFEGLGSVYTSISQLFLRGVGGSTSISARFTLKNAQPSA